jgi:three-Cys-motif partner protein
MQESKQEFGAAWTEEKLDAVEEYIKAYGLIMKNQDWCQTIYLDAFAGSGHITIKDGRTLDGSALRALKYSFDRFYFFDSNKEYLNALKSKVNSKYLDKADKVTYANQNSNDLMKTIDSVEWRKKGFRGVAFLDPYALEIDWDSLAHIARTEIFDVWYLFPLGALNRMLVKTGEIDSTWENKITSFLGIEEWRKHIYSEAPQQNLFGEIEYKKITTEELRKYVISRFRALFPTVSDKAVILRNEKNAPIFLLCFMGSNPSKAAQKASLGVANHLLSKL